MPATGQPEESESAGRFWLVAWLLVLALIVWFTDGFFLLQRDLWMDEVHSWLLLTAPSQEYMLDALADGADFNPPGWYLTSRWLTLVLGLRTEAIFRLFSLIWMTLALVAVWTILARRYSGTAAFIAVAAVATHPLILYQSTEIRFYSFWCMTILWLVVSLDWKPQSRLGAACRILSCCVMSILTVTTHYFGIISVGLVCLPAMVRMIRKRREFLSLLTSLLPAMISLIAVLPYLKGQKAALTRPTWISPPTISDSLMFVEALLPYRPVLIGGFILLTIHYVRKRTPQADAADLTPATQVPLELVCLSVMPLAIVMFSWLLQPALVTRYAMVGVLPTACFLAPILQNLSKSRQQVLGFLLLIAFGNSLNETVRSARLDADQRQELASQLRECRRGPIVMEDRIVWMSLLHRFPDLQATCWLADFEEHQLRQDSALRTVQRDAGRRIQKWFPEYHMRDTSLLAQLEEFYVVTYEGASADMLKYPRMYATSQLTVNVYRFSSAARRQHLSLLTPRRKHFVQKPFDEGKR